MKKTMLLVGLALGLVLAGTATAQTVRIVKVGTGTTLRPYCFLDDNGQLAGYDVDVLKEIDKRLPEYQFDLQGAELDAQLVGVETGKLALASNELAKNPAREQKFLFPKESFGKALLKLVVRKDRNDINKFEDLVGKTTYQTPTTNIYKSIKEWNTANPTKLINLKSVDSLPWAETFKMVDDGRQDATATFGVIFDQIQSQLHLNLKLTGTVWKGDVFFVFNKKETVLQARVDEVLAALKKDGTLVALSQKWLGENIFAE